MILKSDANFEEKLTLGSKNDMRKEFGEFQWEQWQVWKFAVCFATFVESILCLSQKTAEELSVITLKNDEKFEKEVTCTLKNDIGNSENFTGTLKNLKICTLRDFFVKGICLS